MSPLRWDVLLVGLLLAVPVLALGMRGDFTAEEVTSRLPWCLVAGWAVVALLRLAGTPRAKAEDTAEPEQPADSEPAAT
jgi:hypothetical protein